MRCIGHRGAMGHAPENSIASILKALELGAPCVEVDVYVVDSHLMVIHDDRLERTTNGTGYLLERTFEQLRALDAGDGQRIPTLDEVFDAVDRRAGINIELKGPGTAEPVAALIAQYRRRKWCDDLVLVSSFNHRDLQRIRALDGRIKIGVLFKGLPVDDAAMAERLGAYSIHPSIDCIDRRFVQDAHDRNIRVFAYTANSPEEVQRMHDLGVDGVFTSYPERVLELDDGRDQSVGWT